MLFEISFSRAFMVFLSFCISSLRATAMNVGFGWLCFCVSGVFVVGVSACFLVWILKDRTAEADSWRAICTSLQAASALSCWVL